MRHIFVINPAAGKNDKEKQIREELSKYEGQFDFEIYVTKCRGDGCTFTRNYLETHDKSEIYRFYACGGDGSLHDVVNGAVGFPNAEVACYAAGSGNDFIKNFGNGPEFRDLPSLIKGKAKKIDVLKVDNNYCVNILSFGFDGEVTFAMHRYKKWPGVSGAMAYNLAAVSSLLFKMSCPLKVTIDGEKIFDDKGLLVAVGNGFCYGGGFYCTPEAKVDDGLIDVCLVKKISRFKAAGLMKVYKSGEHLHNPKLKDLIVYKKCHTVVLESPKPVAYQVDGETYRETKINISLLPSALNFVIPEKMEESK